MKLCVVCPSCGAEDVHVAVPSRDGAYCQCHGCGHLWHDAQKPPPRGTPAELKRRSDKKDE